MVAICYLDDEVSLEPASAEECLRLNSLAESSALAALSCLVHVVAVLLHPCLARSAEAAVASDPALIDI